MGQAIFTQEERDVVIKLITDVRINVLDQTASDLVSILQSIAKKVFALSQPIGEQRPEKDAESKPATRKNSRKVSTPQALPEEPDPLSF